MNIQGVIFDCDGTLLDTEESHFLAWQKTLQHYNRHFPLEEYLSLHAGQTGELIASFFAKELSCDPFELFRRKSEYYRNARVIPITATIDFVRRLAKIKTLKLAVASASPKNEVLYNLTQIGIAHLFDCILSGMQDLSGYSDLNGVNKPQPYIYQETLRRLAIDPSRSIVVEDSYIGVQAAHAAGCFTVAVPNYFTCHHNFAQADLVLSTFSGLSPRAFFKAVEENLRDYPQESNT